MKRKIVNAKTLLFNFAESKNDNVPRLCPRKVGDNKRRLDVEDIYGLCEFLDNEKIKVPDYVAGISRGSQPFIRCILMSLGWPLYCV